MNNTIKYNPFPHRKMCLDAVMAFGSSNTTEARPGTSHQHLIKAKAPAAGAAEATQLEVTVTTPSTGRHSNSAQTIWL